MPDTTRIEELLSRYEAARRQGRPLTPEELCAGLPDEVCDALRREARDLEAADRLLGASGHKTRIDTTPPEQVGPDEQRD